MIGPAPLARTGLAVVLVVSTAACGPSGHVTPLGRVPHDIQVVFQENEYPVRGANAAAISRSIRARGLTTDGGRRVAALYRWNMEARYRWQPTEDGCVMRDVDVRVAVTTTMPRWERPPDPPPGLEASWERYMSAMHTHEEGHRDHVLRAATELRRELLRLERDNCNFMQGDARDLHDRIVRRWKQLDTEYEIETEHGRTQGAVWPPRG